MAAGAVAEQAVEAAAERAAEAAIAKLAEASGRAKAGEALRLRLRPERSHSEQLSKSAWTGFRN